ncbi:MAG: LytR family transcriptional regulator [Acidimicrobiia bacterium]|nr:MAG: LytR family transcriptional regulator [Acidimicrobiia bacterium]
MPFLKRRDAGVALRPAPLTDGKRRPAEPVTPADEGPPVRPPPPPRKRWPVVVASIIAVLMLAGAVAVSWLQSRDDEAVETTVPPIVVGDSRSALVVVAGEDGRATSIALFVSDGLDDHRLLVAPPALTMQIPGYGDGNLSEALAIEDAELVRLSLVNELGVRIDETVVLGPGDVSTLLGEAVRIDLPNPFIINSARGEVVSVGAGSDVFVPDTAETLLVSQGADSPLEWLQRQRAVWEAIATQVSASPGPAAGLSPILESVAEQLGETAVSMMPVDRVGVGISELLVVSRNSDLLNERIAFLALSESARPRIEILNATTFPGVSRPLAETLIEAGFRLIKTDNADQRTRRDTLIIAQGVANQQAALDAQALLAGGDVVVQPSGSGVVDVSIIVGRDIANR